MTNSVDSPSELVDLLHKLEPSELPNSYIHQPSLDLSVALAPTELQICIVVMCSLNEIGQFEPVASCFGAPHSDWGPDLP